MAFLHWIPYAYSTAGMRHSSMQLLRVFQVIDRKSATLGLPSEEQVVLKGTSNTIYRLPPSNLEAI